MKRIKIVKNRVAALCLSMFLALGLIAPAFTFEAKAEALPQVLESSATVADCVMSYYALCGSAVANVDWINTLYDSLGTSFGTLSNFANDGLLFFEDGVWKPAEELAQNIANTSAYTNLGLGNVFNVSAEEVSAGGGYAVSTGAATLAGACGSVASTGLLPILGGVTAAYWGGIAIGTLINHFIDKYSGNIEMSAPIDYSVTSELLNKRFPGGNVGSFLDGNTVKYIFVPSNIILCGYSVSDYGVFGYACINKTGNTSLYRSSVSNTTYSLNTGMNMFVSGNAKHKTYVWPNMFKSQSEFNTFKNGVLNGTITPQRFQNYSPDIIGPNGNQKTQYDSDTGQYTIPDIKPQIDPQTQSGKPLSLDDWLEFANGVQNNNNGTSPFPDNTTLFQDLLNAIRGTIPDPGPGQDPGTVPVPTPNPDPDYDVDQPDTNAQESETPETDPDLNPPDFVLPNLMEKFPFCIPNDIATIFGKFRNQTRQAPYISWRFNPPGTPIDYTFNLNLSEFEEVAALLRTLELIAFVVGLAYATRYLIGSS